MDLSNLTAEQMEKAKACKTPEELMALAKETGVELTDEQVDAIAGGVNWDCAAKCEDLDCDTYGIERHCKQRL